MNVMLEERYVRATPTHLSWGMWYEELSCVFDEIDQSGDGYTGGAKRVLRVPGLVCTLVLRAELIKPSPED